MYDNLLNNPLILMLSLKLYNQFLPSRVRALLILIPMSFFTTRFLIKTLIWLFLFFVSFRFKLEQLFVMFSILFIIFTNLGTRKPGEKSAYSVFN